LENRFVLAEEEVMVKQNVIGVWFYRKGPVKKVSGGWKVVSDVTGKTLKRTYKSRKAAENAWATSRRRRYRVRNKRAAIRRRKK
jgi:hypothetical protein